MSFQDSLRGVEREEKKGWKRPPYPPRAKVCHEDRGGGLWDREVSLLQKTPRESTKEKKKCRT